MPDLVDSIFCSLISDLSRVRDADGGDVGWRVPAAQLPAAQDVLLPRRPAPRARVAQTPRGTKRLKSDPVVQKKVMTENFKHKKLNFEINFEKLCG